MKKHILLVLAGLLMAPLTARAADAKIPFVKYALPNGLEVILSQDQSIPLVHVQVWYHVGSKDEQPGKTGFAHLFEHMMFQGSRDIPEDTWFKKLDAVGGFGINGTTNTERTNYFESVPSNQLELALWMESDRMGYLLEHIDDKSFHNQQDVVRNERRQSYEMRPYGMLDKTETETFYPPTHPYHHTVIGEHEDLARASLDDVKAFFRRYYAPSNATLTIAGDFDEAQVRRLVDKYFGDLPTVAKPTHPVATPPNAPQKPEVAMEANVQLPRVDLSWEGPVAFGPNEPELDLLALILGDGKTSRLHKRLVYDMRIAQSVRVDMSGREYGGDFGVTVMIRPGHSFAAVRKVVDEEIARVRREPVTADELSRAKIKLFSRFVRSLETNAGRAGQLQRANHYTQDPSEAEKRQAIYRAVTPDAILSAAKSYLGDDRRLVITTTPKPEAPLAGQVVHAAAQGQLENQ
jgi:predicted Zn-dependent peptidase